MTAVLSGLPPMHIHAHWLLSIALALCVCGIPTGRRAWSQDAQAAEEPNIVSAWITQFEADSRTLAHRYRVPLDDRAYEAKRANEREWLARLLGLDFERLDRVGQIDYLLLRSELEYRLANAELEHRRDLEARELLPYWEDVVRFLTDRENVTPTQARTIAESMDRWRESAESAIAGVTELDRNDVSESAVRARLQALRAAELIRRLQRAVREADGFYRGYDPEYSWWTQKPVEAALAAIGQHESALRNKVVGVPESDQETIIGLPIGSEGLQLELQHEWIAHTPEELVELAHREMAWCDREMELASRELGFEADWRGAMEFVKSKHVDPGQQPQMIRELAWEAIRFLEAHDLVTVPPLAANGWRMTMMSPERQRVNPYFLGGDTIIVSFPTDTMTHEEKLMSMRSNNEHFSRATVHHELIPGHHLQTYMLARHRPYRSLFRTPFWIEGWALYWEMLLWDLGFAQGPEDRVGMLFWRKHRCARIIFSLSYHLGTMTPEECVEYLVQRVGHERSAATAEVRRSIMGGYSPLYQAAYMLGGLQIREMHRELVQNGTRSNRDFHDSILKQHSIPIELLRAYLTDQPLAADMQPTWRFAAPTADQP